jgi:hypothetical protein
MLVLAALVTGLFWPALRPSRTLMTVDSERWAPWSADRDQRGSAGPSFNADHARVVWPRAELFRDAIRAGEIPTWDPRQFLGGPFLALWQTQVLYPPTWVLAPLEARSSLAWSVWLHLLVCGAGGVVMLRRAGAGAGAGLVTGLALSLGGAMTLRMGHPSFVMTLAWLPWCLLSVDRALDGGRRRWLIALAVFWALLLLAGQAAMAVLSGYLLLAWILVRGWPADRRGVPRMVLMVLSLAAGTLLAAPQWLPALEVAESSARASRTIDDLRSRALHPAQLVQCVEPEMFGTVLDRSYSAPKLFQGSGRGNTSFANSVGGFAGATTLVLALAGALGGAWQRRRAFWIVAGVVAGALATASPLFAILHGWLPGLGFSNVGRAAAFAGIGLSVLAGWGAESLGGGRLSLLRRCLVIAAAWGLALALGIFSLVSPSAAEMPGGGPSGRTLFALAVAGLLVAAAPALVQRRLWWPLCAGVVAAELLVFAAPYRIDRPADQVLTERPALSWLREHSDGYRVARFDPDPTAPWDRGLVPSGVLAGFDLRSPSGFGPMHDDRLDAYLAAAGWTGSTPWEVPALPNADAIRSPLFRLLSIRYLVSEPGRRIPELELMRRGGVWIWRAPEPMPPAFLAAGASPSRGFSDTLRTLASPRFDPRRTAIVAGLERPADLTRGSPAGSARIVDRGFGRYTVATSAPGPAWLVVSEAWAPGWRAGMDGAATVPVQRVNGIFQGVPVPAGEHRVTFRYIPPGLLAGFALAGVGLVLTLLFGIARGSTWSSTDDPCDARQFS